MKRTDSLHAEGLRGRVGQLLAEGRFDEAESECRRAVAEEPRSADSRLLLAELMELARRPAEAFSEYHNALALDPGGADARAGLAAVLRQLGQAETAERAVSEALMAAPSHAGALNVRAALLFDRGDFEGAARGFLEMLSTVPERPGLQISLGVALYFLQSGGNTVRAAELATEWLRGHGEDPTAQYLGAVVLGRDAPDRAPQAYVRDAFDRYAATFDRTLAVLEYRAPALLAAAVARELAAGGDLDVLDAGCGTGLCGAWLKPYARVLTGVDLSAGMLAQARERAQYNALVEEDLPAFLAAHPRQYDLIVAADVFCYFGSLAQLLSAATKALRPGGLLAFTVERLEERLDELDREYGLGLHGRYAHDESALRQTLARLGLSIRQLTRAPLRLELGRPVEGVVVVASPD